MTTTRNIEGHEENLLELGMLSAASALESTRFLVSRLPRRVTERKNVFFVVFVFFVFFVPFVVGSGRAGDGSVAAHTGAPR